jgi:HPr kinase/phosphorylase
LDQFVGNSSASQDRIQAVCPDSLAIHASAVKIGDRALVILGASKAGKSSLALALIEGSTVERPVTLIGDDRIILSRRDGNVCVSPHPRIAGMIEKRGYGIISTPYTLNVTLAAIVDLQLNDCDVFPSKERAGTCRLMEKDFPSLYLYPERLWAGRKQVVLDWLTATLAAHPA